MEMQRNAWGNRVGLEAFDALLAGSLQSCLGAGASGC